jgi:CHRD domain
MASGGGSEGKSASSHRDASSVASIWRIAIGLRCLSGLLGATLVLLFSGRALATTGTVSVQLNGSQEVPADTSTATGTCAAQVDTATGNVTFSGTFSGLRSAATGSQNVSSQDVREPSASDVWREADRVGSSAAGDVYELRG